MPAISTGATERQRPSVRYGTLTTNFESFTNATISERRGRVVALTKDRARVDRGRVDRGRDVLGET